MADGFHPLRRGTIMTFGTLEFMSLGSGYDMILLPPRAAGEPRPEPIPPQSVRGNRSGHRAGGTRRGRQRSRIPDPTTEARVRPALPPHIPHQIARSSGPTGARGRAHEASSSAPRTSCPAPVEGEATTCARPPKGGQRGLNIPSSSTRGWGKNSGTSRVPFWAQERSRHLRLFLEHFVKRVHGSSRAPLP